jgi:hypothetical protein
VDLAQMVQLPQRTLEVFSHGPVAVTFAADVPWLDFSTPGGDTVSPGHVTPALTTVVLNPILLGAGVQMGEITVSSSLGQVAVPVTVNVTGKQAYCDVNRDGVVNFDDVNAVQARSGTLLGQPGYHIDYDVERDGDIDMQDVGLVSACIDSESGNVYRAFLPVAQR